jgi:TBC1 domain family member 8/9
MSEALLFLGRKGLDNDLHSQTNTPRKDADAEGSSLTKEEQFLGSVSSFIRRCFEYADPDSAIHIKARNGSTDAEAAAAISQFSIGDDEEDDLVDLNDSKPSSPVRARAFRSNTLDSQKEVVNLPPVPSETKPNTHAANAALDPANPLFISLPTFRMVILADEILESFFDTGFPNTFHLADQPIPSTSSMANLTTFANLGRSASIASPALGGVGVAPPGKGLRGMLDGIVNDGMRVATEVRRRMEEAQRELERAGAEAGAAKEEDDDDDEPDDRQSSTVDADRRSVFEGDRDLLDTAEAEAIGSNGASSEKHVNLLDEPIPNSLTARDRAGSVGEQSGKVVEFER